MGVNGVEKYRRKNDPVRKNKEGRTLFEPVHRSQVLKREGHWIPRRKRTYILWFKFLQYCERDKSRIVDWSKYDGWGSSNYILGVKPDDWWKDNWKELFGTKERGQNPKYDVSTQNIKFDGLRIPLLVYEYSLKFPDLPNYELSQKIQERESKKRYPIPSFTEGLGVDGGVIDKRTVQRRMSNYIKRGNEIMDNVCLGKFP